MVWSNLSLIQKVALVVSLPVTGALLYLLLKKQDDEEDRDHRKVVTSRQTIIEVKVPSSLVGAIIGSQGANIKQIQANSGARVNFKDEDRSPQNEERTVIIRGTTEAAQRAELLIRKIIADQPVLHTEVIYVPQTAVGRIIGRGGETIRHMSRASRCKINVDRSDDRRSEGMKQVTLIGSTDAIGTAKDLLLEKVQEEEAYRSKMSVAAANRQDRQQQNRRYGDGGQPEPATAAVAPLSHQVASPTSAVVAAAGAEDERWADGGWNQELSPATQHYYPEAEGWPEHTEFLEVYVSAVEHPGHFWVQVLSSKSTQLDRLMEDMTRVYTNPQFTQATCAQNRVVGDIVAAPLAADSLWYRARVIEVKDDMVDVYYVDYGDSDLVPLNKVMTLRSDFLSLPFQAFECCLAKVKPTGEHWSEDSIVDFEMLTHSAKWRVLMARTVCYQQDELGSMPCIELVDTNGAEDVNVAEALVTKGLAAWRDDAEDSPGGAAHADTAEHDVSKITDDGQSPIAVEEDITIACSTVVQHATPVVETENSMTEHSSVQMESSELRGSSIEGKSAEGSDKHSKDEDIAVMLSKSCVSEPLTPPDSLEKEVTCNVSAENPPKSHDSGSGVEEIIAECITSDVTTEVALQRPELAFCVHDENKEKQSSFSEGVMRLENVETVLLTDSVLASDQEHVDEIDFARDGLSLNQTPNGQSSGDGQSETELESSDIFGQRCPGHDSRTASASAQGNEPKHITDQDLPLSVPEDTTEVSSGVASDSAICSADHEGLCESVPNVEATAGSTGEFEEKIMLLQSANVSDELCAESACESFPPVGQSELKSSKDDDCVPEISHPASIDVQSDEIAKTCSLPENEMHAKKLNDSAYPTEKEGKVEFSHDSEEPTPGIPEGSDILHSIALTKRGSKEADSDPSESLDHMSQVNDAYPTEEESKVKLSHESKEPQSGKPEGSDILPSIALEKGGSKESLDQVQDPATESVLASDHKAIDVPVDTEVTHRDNVPATVTLVPEIKIERAASPEGPIILMEEIITETEIIIESFSDVDEDDVDEDSMVDISKLEHVPAMDRPTEKDPAVTVSSSDAPNALAACKSSPVEEPSIHPQKDKKSHEKRESDAMVVRGTDEWEIQFKGKPPTIKPAQTDEKVSSSRMHEQDENSPFARADEQAENSPSAQADEQEEKCSSAQTHEQDETFPLASADDQVEAFPSAQIDEQEENFSSARAGDKVEKCPAAEKDEEIEESLISSESSTNDVKSKDTLSSDMPGEEPTEDQDSVKDEEESSASETEEEESSDGDFKSKVSSAGIIMPADDQDSGEVTDEEQSSGSGIEDESSDIDLESQVTAPGIRRTFGVREDESSSECESEGAEGLGTFDLKAMLSDAKQLIQETYGGASTSHGDAESLDTSSHDEQADDSDDLEEQEAAVAAALKKVYSAADDLRAMIENAKQFMEEVHEQKAPEDEDHESGAEDCHADDEMDESDTQEHSTRGDDCLQDKEHPTLQQEESQVAAVSMDCETVDEQTYGDANTIDIKGSPQGMNTVDVEITDVEKQEDKSHTADMSLEEAVENINTCQTDVPHSGMCAAEDYASQMTQPALGHPDTETVQAVDLPNIETAHTVDRPDTETKQAVDLPDTETKQTVDLLDTETMQAVDFPDTETMQAVDLPDSETATSVALPDTETMQAVDLPDTETKQTVDLLDTETMQAVDLPDTETMKAIDLPDTETATSVTLPDSVTAQAVDLPDNENMQAIDLPDTETPPSVALPDTETMQVVDLPDTVTGQAVDLPDTDTIQAVDLPDTETTPSVALPDTETMQIVDLPDTVTAQAVDLPDTETMQAVDLPGTETTPSVALPDTETMQVVDLPDTETMQVVDLPDTVSAQAIDLPVDLPDTIPGIKPETLDKSAPVSTGAPGTGGDSKPSEPILGDTPSHDPVQNEPAARPKDRSPKELKLQQRTCRKRSRKMAKLPSLCSFDEPDDCDVLPPKKAEPHGSPTSASPDTRGSPSSSPRPRPRRRPRPRPQVAKVDAPKCDKLAVLDMDYVISRLTPSPPPFAPGDDTGDAHPEHVDVEIPRHEEVLPEKICISSRALLKATGQTWSSSEDNFDDSLDEDAGHGKHVPAIPCLAFRKQESMESVHLSDDSLEGTSKVMALPLQGSGGDLPSDLASPSVDLSQDSLNESFVPAPLVSHLGILDPSIHTEYGVDQLLDVAANFSDDSIDNDKEPQYKGTDQPTSEDSRCDTPAVSNLHQNTLFAKHWGKEVPHSEPILEVEEPANTGPGEPPLEVATQVEAMATEATECLAHTRVSRRSSLKKVDPVGIKKRSSKRVHFKEDNEESSGSDSDSLEGDSYVVYDPKFEKTTVVYDPYAEEHTLLDEWEYEEDFTQL